MRVTLVVPPSSFQLDERVYPMLGVLKVAAALEQTRQHVVDVLDLSGVEQELHLWVRFHAYPEIPFAGDPRLRPPGPPPPDVYGITATMPQMPAAIRILEAIRGDVPGARVILGGAHATLVNAAAKKGVARSQAMLQELLDRFDVVVAGDGELAVLDALQPDARGLIDADQPGTRLFLTQAGVAGAPWPARHLIDLASYRHSVDGVRSTSVIAQLGCPFRCGFCGGRNSPTFRRVRLRGTEDIVAELVDLYRRYDYRAFMFLDDELNVNRAFPDLLREIARVQRQLGVEWRLCGLLKSELFTDEQADLMVAAGFRKILVGFESGDPRILDNMQKNATVEDNTAAVARAHRAGLQIKALMSLGHPGESEATIARTRDWLLAVRPDEFDATVLTVYPGTPYHDEAVETAPGVWTYTARNGDRLHARSIDQLRDTPYYKGIPGQYESFVWTDQLTAQDLVRLRDETERTVRATLGIPWPTGAAAVQYEHSMGCR